MNSRTKMRTNSFGYHAPPVMQPCDLLMDVIRCPPPPENDSLALNLLVYVMPALYSLSKDPLDHTPMRIQYHERNTPGFTATYKLTFKCNITLHKCNTKCYIKL